MNVNGVSRQSFAGLFVRTTPAGKVIKTPSVPDNDLFMLGFIKGSFQNKLIKPEHIKGNSFKLGLASAELTTRDSKDTIIITSSVRQGSQTKLIMNEGNIDKAVVKVFREVLDLIKIKLKEASKKN